MQTNIRKAKLGIKAVKVDANKCVIPARSTEKAFYWRVNLGKKITGTRKQRKFFDTEHEAKEFIAGLGETIVRKGSSTFAIEDKLAHEALALTKELEPFKVSLTHAVHFFIRHAPKMNSVRVSEVIPTYLKTKDDPHYRAAQSTSLNVFARHFGNRAISTIFPRALKDWFNSQGWQPLNERNYMRDISMFFKWCVQNDFAMANPMDKVERPRVVIKTPPIYTVEEANRLLTAAKKNHDLGLLEFVVFAFFTGIRVEELEKVDWSMVVWEQGEICLPEHVTKTSRPRIIPILPALQAWIGAPKEKQGPLFDKTNLRNRKDALFEQAGLESKRNAFRHTFASYHAALHRNFSELQMILGQRTPSVLFTHYVTATRKEDAARFFELRPEPEEGQQGVETVIGAKTPEKAVSARLLAI